MKKNYIKSSPDFVPLYGLLHEKTSHHLVSTKPHDDMVNS